MAFAYSFHHVPLLTDMRTIHLTYWFWQMCKSEIRGRA